MYTKNAHIYLQHGLNYSLLQSRSELGGLRKFCLFSSGARVKLLRISQQLSQIFLASSSLRPHFVLTSSSPRPFPQSVFYLTAVLSPSLIYLLPNEPTYTLFGTSVSTSLLSRASLAPFVSIYLIFQLFAEQCLLGKR